MTTRPTSTRRCTHYTDRTRCEQPAVGWMSSPRGTRVPGVVYCWEHHAASVCEYQEKLGETWTVEAFPVQA